MKRTVVFYSKVCPVSIADSECWGKCIYVKVIEGHGEQELIRGDLFINHQLTNGRQTDEGRTIPVACVQKIIQHQHCVQKRIARVVVYFSKKCMRQNCY